MRAAGTACCERPYGHRLRPGRNGRKRHRFIGKREVFEKKVCGGVHGIEIYLCGVAPPAGAGDQGAQAPQIYREKRFFLKKKCAGECTVLKFICMFAVLSFIEPRGQ